MENCAFNNGDTCMALTYKQCEGCSFYKTREEVDAGRKKAKERIDKLPNEVHNHISRKYYSSGRAYRGDND